MEMLKFGWICTIKWNVNDQQLGRFSNYNVFGVLKSGLLAGQGVIEVQEFLSPQQQ